jgi:hypothetical protein
VPKLSINFAEFFPRAHGNFEEQNKVLESSIIIINRLLEKCNKEENMAVTGAAATSRVKTRL